MKQSESIWDAVAIESDILYRAGFSTLTVWLKHSDEDIYLATERQSRERKPFALSEARGAKEPADLSWGRWVVGQETSQVQFIPAMPDRPIVVRPAYPLRVPTRKNAVFFMSIPIWIRVVVRPPEGSILCEIPSLVLSNTWFGDPTSGELCYALRTRALRSLDEIEDRPYVATCPISVQNHAPAELNFERLCVQVQHLNVYRARTRLWTNELEVRFQGEEHSSQITIGKQPPAFAIEPEVACLARKPAEKTLLTQSFSFLRSLTGF